MMHAHSIHSSPEQLPKVGIRGQLVAQYVLSLYILAVLTIITYVMWLVYLQKNTRYIHVWTLRASTHERPPCVLCHTGNAYAVPHIFTHILPPTIEMAPRGSTLNGQRFICHSNVFTSRTLALRDIQG